eukprot:3497761-Alexandrium_andersonii.AAC.1
MCIRDRSLLSGLGGRPTSARTSTPARSAADGYRGRELAALARAPQGRSPSTRYVLHMLIKSACNMHTAYM